MPGRAPEDGQDAALDRMMFGSKRKPSQPAANDADTPDFLPPIADDEADLLVARANHDRRRNADRREGPDRRQPAQGRRGSEYVPLRTGNAARGDEGRRGPLLLLGALVIVAVFAFVVWSAYRDGVQGDDPEAAPELSTAGAFKTPPRVVPDAPIVAEPVAAPAAAETTLAGPPPSDSLDEQRPISLTPPPQAAAPAPSKYTAPPPAPLKPPEKVATVTAAAPPPAAKPPVQAAPKPVEPKAVAAAPAPTPTGVGGPSKPVFAPYGDHVVQLAATSSEASANAEWTRLSKDHPDLLSGAERFVVQADVNGKTVYRLRVGTFGSKADAVAFCAAFKAKGGNCLPAVK